MKNFVKLSKNEMKMVVGGYGGGGCSNECQVVSDCAAGYTCAELVCSVEEGTHTNSCVPNNVKTVLD